MPDEALCMWVFYWQSSDYPGKFVVRLNLIGGDGIRVRKEPSIVCPDTPENYHALFQWFGHLTFLAPHNREDPVIMGTWI